MAREDDLFSEAMRSIAVGNIRNARRLLREAAESEHLPAMMIYAAYVEHGIGGNPNEHKALAYYRRAAELGDPMACIRVSKWHCSRKQIPQAKFWLHKTYNNRVRLAEVRLDLENRSCKTTASVKAQLWHFHAKPESITASERAEVEALITAYENRRPNVANAQAGRDKMRESKRQQREVGGSTT